MDAVPHRLSRWWRGLDDQERRRSTFVACCVALYLAHYLIFCIPQPFYIEDAGISFAYARNLVEGEVLVTWRGGERVEGFSNPLWTFLIAGFYGLGLSPWSSSKLMGAVFGAITLPLAYALVRRARPDRPDAPQRADVALLAPLFLAASPQFVLWNASGLENSLFCVLLAGGTLRLLRESADGDGDVSPIPWSGLLFAGLAATRPEGILYAGIAALTRVGFSALDRQPLAAGAWLLSFGLPFGAFQAWRYDYFAWPYPNTYYAKVLDNSFKPFGWTVRGWKYIKDYLLNYGMVGGLPLVMIGLGGLRRWRKWTVLFFGLALTLLIAWDGRKGLVPIPIWWRSVSNNWVEIRVWGILAVAVLLGLQTLTRPGWRSRGLLWAACATSTFFILWSGGDWMKGFRWFNPVSLTLLPLIAIGLGELLDAVPALSRPLPLGPISRTRLGPGFTLRNLLIALPALAFIGVSAWNTNALALGPETAVRDVKRRVDYMRWVQQRLDLDRVTLLDVDMGAHVYFTDWKILDMAGLVDVPIARHRGYDKTFMEEYLFEENSPDFAHVHAGWAKSTRIPQIDAFKDRYLEIPGFPSGGSKLHVGNHVRRDLFIHTYDDSAEVPAPIARFAGRVQLIDATLPAPEVAPGGKLTLDSGWHAGLRKDGFRILAALTPVGGDRPATVAALPPGYDWYRPDAWRTREVVRGRYPINIPDDLPTGDYRLALALLDEKTGQILPLLGEGEEDPFARDPLPGDASAEEGEGHGSEEPEAEPAAEEPAAEEPAAEEPAAEQAPPAIALADRPIAESGWLPGTYLLPTVVHIVSPNEALGAAEADRLGALAEAQADSCEAAWSRWKDATRHAAHAPQWAEDREADLKRAVAACYVARAAEAEDEAARATWLIEGRAWDHHLPSLVAAARDLAQTYVTAGRAAADSEDWEQAFQRWTTALRLDPRLSWVRRDAEDARDHRLRIGEYKPEPAKPVKRKHPPLRPGQKPTWKPGQREDQGEDPEEPAAEEEGGEDPPLGGGP